MQPLYRMQQNTLTYKFICIGNSGVGKSSLALRFSENRFPQKHELTIGVEFASVNLEVEKESIRVNIWDTAGQESFRSITRTYYRDCRAALLVFDVTQRKSYDELQVWLDELEKHARADIQILLVGNKTDLVDKRVVSLEEATAFAESKGITYIETSAKTGRNVKEAFTNVVEAVYKTGYRGEARQSINPVFETNTPSSSAARLCCS